MSKVGIIMGSKSDYPIMKEAENILKDFEVLKRFDLELKMLVKKRGENF